MGQVREALAAESPRGDARRVCTLLGLQKMAAQRPRHGVVHVGHENNTRTKRRVELEVEVRPHVTRYRLPTHLSRGEGDDAFIHISALRKGRAVAEGGGGSQADEDGRGDETAVAARRRHVQLPASARAYDESNQWQKAEAA